MKKVADVGHSIAVLSWDKEVNLPEGSAQFRSQQVATLSGIAHELFTDSKFGELLQALSEDSSLDESEQKNIKVSLKDYEKATKFDEEFVIRRSQTISKGYHAWLKARKENDYKFFADALSDVVALKREEVEILGFEDHPYDTLLDIYEPGLKVNDLDPLFEKVKTELLDLIIQIRSKDQIDDSFLYQKFDKDKQWQYGLHLLENMGYDFKHGRQDLSPHPFTTSFSPQDVRLTTRIDENNFANMTWSCIHEGGHALYEQGLSADHYGLPTGNAISLGIHESQSRLWENNVGRSMVYWKAHYPSLCQAFPVQLNKIDLESFYKAINKIEPSLIRTESDELHYHFHVLIRYEIEKALIEGKIKVKELKDLWNAKYKEYLDVEVPEDSKGILQDVHWGHGSFGYFPTYSLGSFYAAQFFAQAKKDIPNLSDKIAEGDNTKLLSWLRENIHQHGRLYEADELCRKVTGEKLNFDYFMQYVSEKYRGIYGL
jgi:carboxypeptidase Taq